MTKIIGIDLGTTYSAVSIWDEKKKEPIILPNLNGFYTTPSIVSLNKAGEVIVGEDARRNQYAAPEETVAGIKRRMGSDLKIMMCGQEFNPQTISAFIPDNGSSNPSSGRASSPSNRAAGRCGFMRP